ncbi:MAG: AHH domain-containing protein, partial [Candidatus Saccharibacteria bacterium]|nr:AHH domain-containing protein [Candidatus Saccharibacteria bacterium]
GSNGCYARQWYMEGYTVGVLAETAIPLAKAGKLGNVKVADLSKASNGDVTTKLNVTRSLLDEVPAVKYIPSSNSQASSILARTMLGVRGPLQSTLDRWKTLGGDWNPQAHHILLEKFRSNPTAEEATLMAALDNIWQSEVNSPFDINDGAINGVFLPYKLHKGGHSGTDYTSVVRAEMQSFVDQNPSRAQVIAKIAQIREELITGRGNIYKINSVWDESDAGQYMDALANTLSAYKD